MNYPATATATAKPVVSLPGFLSRRTLWLIVICGLAAGFIAYMVINVQVTEAQLSRAEAHRYWWAALIGAGVVLAFFLLIAGVTAYDRRRGLREAVEIPPAQEGEGVPRPLRLELVPWQLAIAALCISLAGVVTCVVLGAPLWVGGLSFLVPLLPVLALEGTWKYERWGLLGAFALICVLQVLHMGEHTTQVSQLLFQDGDLARSHGVFGQLDFELVHFVTDTSLWLTLGGLLLFFAPGNKWLWVAFIAAGLHQVEHFYLFWLYHAHNDVYLSGGFAGIMGEGGMMGSPLDRPYLHFSYNFIVVVPMLVGLWDEARRSERRKL